MDYRVIWDRVRPVVGWGFILLGIAGLFLPVLQGILFLAIGVKLVGRRSRALRWILVHLKLLLRRWAALRTPGVGAVGRWVWQGWQNTSRQQRQLWQQNSSRRRSQKLHARTSRS